MKKSYSIAEARQNLAALVHELECEPSIQLTRRGSPVAILLSIQEYQRLESGRIMFWEAYEAFRAGADLSALEIEPEVFAGLRDRSPGREMAW